MWQSKAIDGLVVAWLDNQDLEHTQAYAASGRYLATLTDEVLRACWIAALKHWANDPMRHAGHNLRVDLEAEMRLRGSAPPFANVATELETIGSAVTAHIKQLDQAGFERLAQSIADKVFAFERAAQQIRRH